MVFVELFGVVTPTLRATIKAIYKSGTLCSASTQRCDLVTSSSLATYYNLEVVIALAFRMNTYETNGIRQKVLDTLCKRKDGGYILFVLFKAEKILCN